MLKCVMKALDYNPKTGVFRWKINRANKKAGDQAGNFNVATGYRTVMVSYKSYYEHRLAWAFVHGKFPPLVDHINGRRDDNRISNLRLLSNADNVRNRTRLNKNNTSGATGVYYVPEQKKWRVSVMVNRKTLHLGSFTTLGKAKLVREQFHAG